MAADLEVIVHSTNQKLGYTGALRSMPPITMDYIPPHGDGRGYMPLELLLMSLAACSGGTIAMLLRKTGKTVTEVQVKAKGIRRDQHPTSFHKIFLEFNVHSGDTGDADIQKAIRLSEESICPVWAMLKNSVEIVTEYKIVAA
jgi:putative redox protein